MMSAQRKSSLVVAQHAAPVLLLIASSALSGCVVTRIGKDYKRDYNFTVTGIVTTEDGTPVQGADITLEVSGPVYEVIDPVTTRKLTTRDDGSFVFAYISHERGVKYKITAHKEGFELQTLSGAAPPPGHHTIRLKKASETTKSSAADPPSRQSPDTDHGPRVTLP